MPDPNDRHILAAAIKCSAQHIVTHNHRDLPAETLEEYDITTIGPDEFLANTFELDPTRGLAALRGIRTKFSKTPMTPSEFLLDLTANGLPQLAAHARDGLEFP